MSFVRAKHRALDILASIASRDPRFVTIGQNAPLVGAGHSYGNHKFPKSASEIFWHQRVGGKLVLILLAKFDFSRSWFRSLLGSGRATRRQKSRS
jgi:hypothetical protein